MYFITSRMPTVDTEPDLNPDFEFDLTNNSSSRAFYCCERAASGKIKEIGSKILMSELKKSKHRQLLLYIHGFNNSPNDIFVASHKLQTFCNAKKANEVLVLPVIWPCDNDMGVVKDYWDDQSAADQSSFSFSRMMQAFMAWRSSDEYNPDDDPCLKRINILAHSMGNRVLRQTLIHWRNKFQPQGLPLLFRNTFLAAPDILNETIHKGHSGELIAHASRNVVVYYASDDLALRASKVSNLKNGEASRRLGHTGPEDMDKTAKNVYAIDCDDINTAYDKPKGHTYFLSGKRADEPGVVFDHIFNTILTGRVFPKDEYRKSTILKANTKG